MVFNDRDRIFDAVPPALQERARLELVRNFCFATAEAATSVIASNSVCGALPFSDGGGTMRLKLWSDPLTEAKVKVGDWIMLSRQKEVGITFYLYYHRSGISTGDDYKMTHRHQWYRVIGVDSKETWPRVVRVQGPEWGYEELKYDSSGNEITPGSTVPIYDRSSPAGSLTITSDLRSVAPTATILPNVIGVFRKVVAIE